MQAHIFYENNCMTVAVEGEINTITTPQLTDMIGPLDGVQKLIFDMTKVRYVSSAGLRLVLSSQRTMKASGGEMLVRNCSQFVMETFVSVGYDRIIKLETESGTKKADARPKQ